MGRGHRLRVIGQTDFASVFVPPSCDDGGLSIGAALYAYHHVLEGERVEAPAHSDNIAALGRAPSPQYISRALTAASDEFEVETGVDLAENAATWRWIAWWRCFRAAARAVRGRLATGRCWQIPGGRRIGRASTT